MHREQFKDQQQDEQPQRRASVPVDLDDARPGRKGRQGEEERPPFQGSVGWGHERAQVSLGSGSLAFVTTSLSGLVATPIGSTGCIARERVVSRQVEPRRLPRPHDRQGGFSGRTEFYTPPIKLRLNGKAHREARETPPSEEQGEQVERKSECVPHQTDYGNAKRIVQRFGHDLHYLHQGKTWLIWDERRWAEDVTGEAIRRVKDTQQSLYRWAAEKLAELGELDDDDERKGQAAQLAAVLKHSLKWEDARAHQSLSGVGQVRAGHPRLAHRDGPRPALAQRAQRHDRLEDWATAET